MFRSIPILLLVCLLPTLTLSATVQCRYGDRTLNQGETRVIEQNCARHVCTCDPGKTGSNMCETTMTGCLDGASNTCYKPGDSATLAGSGGSPVHCVCQRKQSDGSFTFANCRSETCKDSRTGEEKKKGESVTVVNGGVTYVCTCAGVDGYQGCRTEESLSNDGKCLDHATGKYVEKGATAVTKQGDASLHCTCDGTNSYINCRSTTCPDVDGSVKNAGEKVTVRNGDVLLVCDCAGLDGYKNCKTKADYDNADKCKDLRGHYADKGQRFRALWQGKTYECTCDGNNSGKNCSVV